MFTIYKCTNKLNGNSYIGFDCNWPYRKCAHKHAVKRGSTLVFHNAIRKYGWENFEWEVLYQSDDREDTLKTKEEYYIREHNTHYIDGTGYNMTYGGEATLGWVPTEETKRKISEANKGRVSPNKGKLCPWTSERNRNNTGKKAPKLEKEYLITDPNGIEYQIKGLTGFCKEKNLHVGNMSSVANGRLNHYKKWKCMYLDK